MTKIITLFLLAVFPLQAASLFELKVGLVNLMLKNNKEEYSEDAFLLAIPLTMDKIYGQRLENQLRSIMANRIKAGVRTSDPDKRLKWFRLGARGGDWYCQHTLGWIYEERGEKEEALKWYRQALKSIIISHYYDGWFGRTYEYALNLDDIPEVIPKFYFQLFSKNFSAKHVKMFVGHMCAIIADDLVKTDTEMAADLTAQARVLCLGLT